mgnify:CR=1 FL=1
MQILLDKLNIFIFGSFFLAMYKSFWTRYRDVYICDPFSGCEGYWLGVKICHTKIKQECEMVVYRKTQSRINAEYGKIQ